MKTLSLFFIFLLTCLQTYGNDITGELIDSTTNSPIQFATIYIDGTTLGTLSDSTGKFSIQYNNPGQIVVRHLSYQTRIIEIKGNRSRDLRIKLLPRNVLIQQVSVGGKDLREKNLGFFNLVFLGNDEWGRNATITNDSVLRFTIEYYDESEPDSSLVGKFKYFEAKALEPLQINLPKLGYNLEYDLVKFTREYTEDLGFSSYKILGYSYFKELNPERGKQRRRIRINRLKAFYNSTMHFNRSFYNEALKENGYRILQYFPKDTLLNRGYKTFDRKTCGCINYDSDELHITGMNKTHFLLDYFHEGKKPANLHKKELWALQRLRSYFYLVKDTCVIRKDGTLPGGEIFFEGPIVEKRIGASLPSNIEF